jgi:hypothetical protein
MYRKLPESSGRVLGYVIEDRLTRDEVEQMQQELRVAMDRHGSVRLLVRAAEMEDVEPSAVWQDLKMTPDYVRNIERLAVVGDERWHEWAAKLTDTVAEARFFEPAAMDRAWTWLREEDRPRDATS